jgi:hypothetical protein
MHAARCPAACDCAAHRQHAAWTRAPPGPARARTCLLPHQPHDALALALDQRREVALKRSRAAAAAALATLSTAAATTRRDRDARRPDERGRGI